MCFARYRIKNNRATCPAIALVGFCNDIQLPGAWIACMDVGCKAVATLSGT